MTFDHPDSAQIVQTMLAAVAATRGHFRYESGHHGDLWLNLDSLFVDAGQMRRWVSALGPPAAACRPEFICGPLTGGAFVAQWLAAEIGAGFIFAERFVLPTGAVQYRLPESLWLLLPGRRVLLVDDVINAGSAVFSTLADLQACGVELVGLASLLTLGQTASSIAQQHSGPFFALASLERGLWLPEACPLCRSGTPLTDPLTQSQQS